MSNAVERDYPKLLRVEEVTGWTPPYDELKRRYIEQQSHDLAPL
jgi:hypothetical protein